jgi:hypothetical protein
MVALKTERRVYLWHMSPQAIPKESAKKVTFAEIFQMLNDAFNKGTAFTYLDSDGNIIAPSKTTDVKKCIFIADIQVSKSKNNCAILFIRGNPDVAHPSFINPLARVRTH